MSKKKLQEGEKYLLFGLLLKKSIEKKIKDLAYTILQKDYSIDKKIAALQKIYKSIDKKHNRPEPTEIIDQPKPEKYNGQIIIAEEKQNTITYLKKSKVGQTYKLLHVKNGVDLISLLKSKKYSLSIIDANIPLLDGYDITRFVIDLNIPIIILTHITP